MTDSLRPVEIGELWGGAEILPDEPRCTVYEDVYYLPNHWALFDRDGILIPESAFRRHGGSEAPGSPSCVDIQALDFEHVSESIVFGGSIHNHYGHFLCTSLSRVWAFDRFPSYRIFFSGAQFAGAAATQIGSLIFSSYKVDEARAIQSPRPLKFSRVIVPESSFDEQWRAFDIHRDMCMKAGKGLPTLEKRPAYLSKTKLQAGVHRFENEIEIEEELARQGVEIIYPEQLSIEEQISLFSSSRTLMGMGGSAFHTHVFAPANGRIINIQAFVPMISNQIIFDKLAMRQVDHFVPTEATTDAAPTEGFVRTMRLTNPGQLARELLTLI